MTSSILNITTESRSAQQAVHVIHEGARVPIKMHIEFMISHFCFVLASYSIFWSTISGGVTDKNVGLQKTCGAEKINATCTIIN